MSHECKVFVVFRLGDPIQLLHQGFLGDLEDFYLLVGVVEAEE